MIVSEDSRCGYNVYAATGVYLPGPAAQPGGVATRDTQTLNRGRDVAGDVDHPSQPLRVERGRVSFRIGRIDEIGGIAAADGDAFIDVDHLGPAAVFVHAGVDTGGDLDDVAWYGLVQGFLHGPVITSAGANVQLVAGS